jgi:hypothetical protein
MFASHPDFYASPLAFDPMDIDLDTTPLFEDRIKHLILFDTLNQALAHFDHHLNEGEVARIFQSAAFPGKWQLQVEKGPIGK